MGLRRNKKIESELRRLIAEDVIKRRLFAFHFIAINRVRVDQGLSRANVYYSAFCDSNIKDSIHEILNKSTSYYRSFIFKKIKLKKSLRIEFFFDNFSEELDRLNKLIS